MIAEKSLFFLYWNVSPICFSIYNWPIRWYGVFFATGVFLFSRLFEKDTQIESLLPRIEDRDRIFTQSIFSTLLGAKIGYVLLYTPPNLRLSILFALQGFSFHGGLLGLCCYIAYLSLFLKKPVLILMDRMAVYAPWSLALGRLGNFFNSELLGRATSGQWGVYFPYGEAHPIARHPSQLYEFFGEGLVLGALMWFTDQSYPQKPKGMRAIVFLISYGLIRLFLENFRDPDPQIGFLYWGLTLGQILCSAMILSGLLCWTMIWHKTYLNYQKD